MPSGRIRSFAGEVTNLIASGQGSGKKRLWEELGVKVGVSDPGEPGVEGVTLAPPHCERRIPALATQRLTRQTPASVPPRMSIPPQITKATPRVHGGDEACPKRSGRMTTEADEYSQDELKGIARDYLRDNENREYRSLARKGELDEYLEGRADAVRRFAHRLIATGTAVPQAWSWAIRVVILKSEMD